jgi:hypothetical protein
MGVAALVAAAAQLNSLPNCEFRWKDGIDIVVITSPSLFPPP